MDSDSIIIMLIVMALLTLLSGFFSATETAFSSFNRIHIKSLASNGNRKAEKVLSLDEKYEKLITSVLIGNNIVNISLTTVAALFFVKILPSVTENTAGVISTVVITIIVLVFGEITPKTLAKDHAEGYVLATADIVSVIIVILTPLTVFFSLIAKLFSSKNKVKTTEDDIITMVDEAEQEGELDKDESELIRNAIEFGDVTAGEILTPRVDITTITPDQSIDEIKSLFFETGYSRLPVVGESVDDVVGVLHEKDFFMSLDKGETDFSDYYQKPFFVSKHHKVDELLRDLQKEKCHMAFVIDEFGGLLGIVTMEDILEELIGEIWDEHDDVESGELTVNKDGSVDISGTSELDVLFDFFDIKEDEDGESVQTVNGWVQKIYEGIPEKGETMNYKDLLITVTDCDDKMVLSVNIKRIIPEEKE